MTEIKLDPATLRMLTLYENIARECRWLDRIRTRILNFINNLWDQIDNKPELISEFRNRIAVAERVYAKFTRQLDTALRAFELSRGLLLFLKYSRFGFVQVVILI